MDDDSKILRNLLLGLAAFGIALFICLHYYFNIEEALAIFWLFGIGYGIVIQRSKFCFSAAFRDIFLFKRGGLMKAIIVGLIVATIGFAVIMFMADRTDGIPAHAKVNPVGLQVPIAGIIFGFGMVISGGCASGTLWRAGEGYTVQWVALAGMVLGTIPIAALWGTIYDGYISDLPKIWLPNSLGWGGALFLTLVLLLAMYILISWWESRAEFKFSGRIEQKSENPTEIIPIVKENYKSVFYKPWPYLTGGILLGTLNAFEYVFAKPWGITTALSRWGGWMLEKTGLMNQSELWAYYTQYKLIDNPPHMSGSTLLVLGLIFGAFATALMAGEFKIRVPKKKIRFAQGFAGGLLMGFGARLAMGCNIGGFFSAVPSLALAAWIFVPGLAVGAWLGTKALRKLA
ncbi:YeeE/YedE family protein [Chloroflexota bacterium]